MSNTDHCSARCRVGDTNVRFVIDDLIVATEADDQVRVCDGSSEDCVSSSLVGGRWGPSEGLVTVACKGVVAIPRVSPKF
jgi:hypothetical protein